MLTVTLLLSGPHRHAMLETAFSSIPIDSPAVSEVLVRHQGGRWQWGGELRERILAHPKVRLVEFPDHVDWKESFNRTLDAVNTPWALMLPDDDFLVRPAAQSSFEYVRQRRDLGAVGMIAFGWYYLKDGRYTPNRFRRPTLAAMLTCTPKFCSTLLNVRRVRELGGFGDMGGFVDAELYGRLAYEFDAVIAPTRVGVYRLHEGQESNRIARVYAPYAPALTKSLSPYAKSVADRVAFEQAVQNFVSDGAPGWVQQGRELVSALRSVSRPRARPDEKKLKLWSAG